MRRKALFDFLDGRAEYNKTPAGLDMLLALSRLHTGSLLDTNMQIDQRGYSSSARG